MSNSRFEKLLELLEQQPDDLFLQYALGMEFLGMGKTEEAQKQFRAIIAADAHHVASYYQLAKLVEASNEAEAIQLYETGMAEAKLKNDLKTMNEFRSALDELRY